MMDYSTKLQKFVDFWKYYYKGNLINNEKYICIINDLKKLDSNLEHINWWLDTFIKIFNEWNENDKIILINDICFNIDWFNCLNIQFKAIDKFFEFLKFVFSLNKKNIIFDFVAMLLINLVPEKLEVLNSKTEIKILNKNFKNKKELENYLFKVIIDPYFEKLSQNKSIMNIEIQNSEYKSFLLDLLYKVNGNMNYKNNEQIYRIFVSFRESVDNLYKEIYIVDNNNVKNKFNIQNLIRNLFNNDALKYDKDLTILNNNYFNKILNFFEFLFQIKGMNNKILEIIKKNEIFNFKKNEKNLVYYLKNYLIFYKEFYIEDKWFFVNLIDYLVGLDSQLQTDNLFKPTLNKMKIINHFNNIYLILFTFFYKILQIKIEYYKNNNSYEINDKYYLIKDFYDSLNFKKNNLDIKKILYEMFKYFNYISFVILLKPCFVHYISIFIFHQNFSNETKFKIQQIKSIFKIIYKEEYKNSNLLCFLYSLINKTSYIKEEIIFYVLYKLLKYCNFIIKNTKNRMENYFKENKVKSLNQLNEREIQYLNSIFKKSNFIIVIISFTKILKKNIKKLNENNFEKVKESFKKILSYNKKFFNFFLRFNPKITIIINSCEINFGLKKTKIKVEDKEFFKISPIKYRFNDNLNDDFLFENCQYSMTNSSNFSISNSIYTLSTKYDRVKIDSEENYEELNLDNIYDPIIYLDIDFFNIFIKPNYNFNIKNKNEKNFIDFKKIFEINNKSFIYKEFNF